MKFAKILSLVFIIWSLASCGNKKDTYDPNVYYTCSMHQQIHENKPGKCPICHMDLTKVVTDPNQKNTLKLSETQMELADIVVDTLRVGKISEEIQLHAKLTVNENNLKTIDSRVPGRIDRLYFKNTGDYIHKGDLLYSIYSEELLNAQKEYLFALDRLKANVNNPDYTQIVQSSKNKLLIWGMTETQIEKLKSSNDLSTSVPIYSKVAGTIQELKIKEGEYVFEGSSIMQIADLSTLWIEAQIFSNETEYIREHQPVNVIISAYPNETLNGKIDYKMPVN
jgi:Cu(I)/Ag(I) efflux system membrane fusion protein